MDGHVWSQNLEGDQALGHCVLSSAFVMSRSALIVLKLWYSHGNGTIGSEFVFFGVWTQDFYIYTIKHVPSVDQSSNFIHPKCLILAEAISMEAQAQSYQRHAQTDQENSNESENGEANYNCRWKGQCVF